MQNSYLLQPATLFSLVAVAFVEAGGGELTYFVADHVLGYVDGDMTPTIVYADCVAHHVGGKGAGTRPTLDYALLVPLVHPEDFFLKVVVYERPLFS